MTLIPPDVHAQTGIRARDMLLGVLLAVLLLCGAAWANGGAQPVFEAPQVSGEKEFHQAQR